MDNSDLAKRMKEYEAVSKTRLMKRTPVVLRLDGKAFHTFTRGFQKPFDEVLIKTMQETMKYLCENIQGCVLGYTQSDEITLVLIDYKKLNTNPWFDYEVQKMCSVTSSMATMAFNKHFLENYLDLPFDTDEEKEHFKNMCRVYNTAVDKGAMFDCRAFNLPQEEVTNNIYWRQLDASRNSIQMLGQAYFSHRELQNKSCNDIQDMLMTQKGINWNDLLTHLKRGSCCIKEQYKVFIDESGLIYELDEDETSCSEIEVKTRNRWVIDKEIPIFKGEGRAYIDKLVFIESEE